MKKHLLKKTSVALVCSMLVSLAPAAVIYAEDAQAEEVDINETEDAKAGWKKDSKGWWFLSEDGSYPKNMWMQDGGKWYHFDKSGYMEANKWIGNYYVKADGTMAVNEWVDGDKYFVDENGAWVKGKKKEGTTDTKKAEWKKSNGKWWYDLGDGTYPANKWFEIEGSYYHFDKSGYMEANKWVGNYFVKANGVMATNEWVDGGKYYVDAEGKWAQGLEKSTKKGQWKKDNKGWWYKKADGSYYKSQWAEIDGKVYHFNGSGYMDVDTWIGDRYVDADGNWSATKIPMVTAPSLKTVTNGKIW